MGVEPGAGEPTTGDNRPAFGALTWPLAGVALLLVEYLAVSYTYDARPLLARGGVQGGLGHVGTLAPLAALVLTATLVAGGRPFLRTLARLLSSTERSSGESLICLAANAGCFGLLMFTTGHLLDSLRSDDDPSGLIGLWLFATVSTSATAMLLAVPARAWAPILRELRRPLLIGLGAGLSAWLAGLGSVLLWDVLSLATLQLVASALAPFTSELVYIPEEAIVGTETFFVIIAPVCSGYEGIGLIAVFMGLYLWAARDDLRFPQAYALLPLSMVAVWLGNVVRIVALIAVGIHISPNVALGGFHSKAGWIFFCAIALGIVALAQRWRYVQRADNAGLSGPEDAHAVEHENPVAAYLGPLLILIATKLFTGLFTDGFDALYPLSVLTVALTLLAQRKHLPRPRWSPSWHAPLIGALMFPLWLWAFPTLEPGAGQRLQQGLAALPPAWAGTWLTFRVLGSCVTVPIAEELAFRGFLLRRLIDGDFTSVSLQRWTPLAVIVSSVAFGALHQAYLGGTLAGLAFALAQRARGRLGDAIVAHAITNGLIAVDVLMRGSFDLWA